MEHLNSNDPAVFKDDKLSVGGQVKCKGEVLKEYFRVRSKPPNLNCRVESFGRICQTFDARRRQWVYEMGFGWLLYLSGDMHLPRQLCYWLMTRIDPYRKMIITPDGRCLRLSRNQVHWVLGIPNGSKAVPSYKTLSRVQREKAKQITYKYGQTRKFSSTKSREYDSVGIPVCPQLMERLECHWEPQEEEEFKTLFLMLSLEMVLCPTLSSRLSSELVPALTCAMDAADYDWCTLVLTKLFGSVRSFGRRFYSKGHAGGCGGCTLFALIFYLDRLDREAVEWGAFPRLKVWNAKQVGLASKEDRLMAGGDYGNIGTLDVAYGENHPREARDTDGPAMVELHDDMECSAPKRRRGASSTKITQNTDENSSDVGNTDICEGPRTLTRPAPYGFVASNAQSILEAMCSFVSKDAMTLLQRMTSLILSTRTRFGGYPLLGEFISFSGGGYDLRQLMHPSMFNFVNNPCCRVLIVVSELFTPTLPRCDPLFFRICIALKSTLPSRMILLHGDSVAPSISFDNTMLISSDQAHDDIFKCCMKGICESKLSRNMVLVDRNPE